MDDVLAEYPSPWSLGRLVGSGAKSQVYDRDGKAVPVEITGDQAIASALIRMVNCLACR